MQYYRYHGSRFFGLSLYDIIDPLKLPSEVASVPVQEVGFSVDYAKPAEEKLEQFFVILLSTLLGFGLTLIVESLILKIKSKG